MRGDVRVWANSAYNNGGAFYLMDGSSLYLGVWGALTGDHGIWSNTAGIDGGAVYLINGSSLSSFSGRVFDNWADGNGGAFAAYNDSQVVLTVGSCDLATERCQEVYGNAANHDNIASGEGGAVYVDNSELYVANAYLHHNSASAGGAIGVAGSNSNVSLHNTCLQQHGYGQWGRFGNL
jgi:hypothetical protein